MRHPLSCLLISTSLALASCSGDGGSCDGELCDDPFGDPSDPSGDPSDPSHDTIDNSSRACQRLQTCCDQLPEHYEGEGGELYRTRCVQKLDEASKPSATTSCAELVDSLTHFNFCLLDDEDDSSSEASCEDLIACAEQVAPDTVAMLKETYGPNGACWTSTEDIQQACRDSCRQALDAYHDSGQCVADEEEQDLYPFPHWLVFDEDIIEYCEHEVMCDGLPDTQEDPIGLRIRLCEDEAVRWIKYGPPPCNDQVRAELACRLERGGCDTETWCGPEIDDACTRQPVSP